MIELDTILIKVVSRCNIDCHYCYVYNMGDTGWASMPKQMSHETTVALATALGDLYCTQKRPFAVVLHGGEPLLLGPIKLKRLITTLRDALPPETAFSLQTNGILITEEILHVCSEIRTTLSVSIDGPRHIHDRNRVGYRGQGTYDKVMRGIELLRDHRDADFLYSGLLAVVDPYSDPSEVYSFFKMLSPPEVNFLYRDGNHTCFPAGKKSFQSAEYGEWFVRLLDIYLYDPYPLRIRFLDDLMRIVIGGTATKDGVGLTDFGVLIVDTDGSIAKNDTLKSAFNGADRFTQKWSVHTHRLGEILNSTEFADYHVSQRPTSRVCRACPELKVCGGGMALHRWRDENGFDNPSVYCADQLLLIRNIRNQITALRKCA